MRLSGNSLLGYAVWSDAGRHLAIGVGAIAGAVILSGCGGNSEEPAATVPVVNEPRIENTVVVPAPAADAPKVVVKAPAAGTKTTTTTISGATTTAAAKPAVAAAPAKAAPVAVAPAA